MNVENWFDFKEEDLAVEKANSLRIRVHLKIKKNGFFLGIAQITSRS